MLNTHFQGKLLDNNLKKYKQLPNFLIITPFNHHFYFKKLRTSDPFVRPLLFWTPDDVYLGFQICVLDCLGVADSPNLPLV